MSRREEIQFMIGCEKKLVKRVHCDVYAKHLLEYNVKTSARLNILLLRVIICLT